MRVSGQLHTDWLLYPQSPSITHCIGGLDGPLSWFGFFGGEKNLMHML